MTRNAGRKKRIRERATREGVSYREAGRNDRADAEWNAAEPTFQELAREALAAQQSPEQLLETFVEDWSADREGTSVDALGVDSHDFGWYPGLDTVVVHELAPQRWTVETQVDEEYTGMLAMSGSFRATLAVEGALADAEADAAEIDGWVTVIDADLGESRRGVVDQRQRDVEVEFTALVDHDGQGVEDFEVTGVRVVALPAAPGSIGVASRGGRG